MTSGLQLTVCSPSGFHRRQIRQRTAPPPPAHFRRFRWNPRRRRCAGTPRRHSRPTGAAIKPSGFSTWNDYGEVSAFSISGRAHVKTERRALLIRKKFTPVILPGERPILL